MQRSSETIGAIAAALAKAQAELTNPEKSLIATIRASNPRETGSDLSLCGALERPRHRAQGARRPRDRDRADDGDRQGGGAHPPHHDARPFVGGMAFVGMAGLRDRRNRDAAPDGGGADLCQALRALHPGRHRRRGRSRRAGPPRSRLKADPKCRRLDIATRRLHELRSGRSREQEPSTDVRLLAARSKVDHVRPADRWTQINRRRCASSCSPISPSSNPRRRRRTGSTETCRPRTR